MVASTLPAMPRNRLFHQLASATQSSHAPGPDKAEVLEAVELAHFERVARGELFKADQLARAHECLSEREFQDFFRFENEVQEQAKVANSATRIGVFSGLGLGLLAAGYLVYRNAGLGSLAGLGVQLAVGCSLSNRLPRLQAVGAAVVAGGVASSCLGGLGGYVAGTIFSPLLAFGGAFVASELFGVMTESQTHEKNSCARAREALDDSPKLRPPDLDWVVKNSKDRSYDGIIGHWQDFPQATFMEYFDRTLGARREEVVELARDYQAQFEVESLEERPGVSGIDFEEDFVEVGDVHLSYAQP